MIHLIVVLTLLVGIENKTITESYPVRWLPLNNNFIYLTKMDFGVG